MNNTIFIGKPSIRIKNGKARLIAPCQGIQNVKEIFFEVDEENGKYFCADVSDSFLLMLIEYAQLNDCNIKFEAPITLALLDYVNVYYIPLLAFNISAYHNVDIIAPTLVGLEDKGIAVGTGFSAGVDSFYALYKQLETKYNEMKVTHVLFANVGSQTYDYAESIKIFPEKANRMRKIVSKVDDSLGFISINTNCLEIYRRNIGKGFTGPDARKTCSCVLALRKLFSSYYFSNGPTLDRFSFSSKDPAHFDLFTIDMMNRSGVYFYLKGIETPRRIDKLKYLCKNKVVQDSLSVCVDKNCGVCEKCVRTELELLSISQLENFAKVFDITSFKKSIVITFAKYLAITEEHKLGFVREIEEEAKLNGVRLPKTSYLLSYFVYHPLQCLKKCIKRLLQK